tara:strand:- start:1528 stop:2343 length:816 start_codon:yes stop_codon:yes gene_type:complete
MSKALQREFYDHDSLHLPSLLTIPFTELNNSFFKGTIKKEIAFFSQAIFCKDFKVAGFELLLRTRKHDRLAFSPPKLIIERFESAEQMHQLDRLLIPLAIESIIENGESGVFYNINISSQTLESADVMADILAFINKTKEELKLKQIDLCFEITETVRITDYKQVIFHIEHLRKFGLKIAIDDFGVGNNALLLYALVNPSYVKLSHDLIRHLDSEDATCRITNILTQLRNHHIKVVVEGVESKELLSLAKKLGAEFFQGFLLHRPEVFSTL